MGAESKFSAIIVKDSRGIAVEVRITPTVIQKLKALGYSKVRGGWRKK